MTKTWPLWSPENWYVSMFHLSSLFIDLLGRIILSPGCKHTICWWKEWREGECFISVNIPQKMNRCFSSSPLKINEKSKIEKKEKNIAHQIHFAAEKNLVWFFFPYLKTISSVFLPRLCSHGKVLTGVMFTVTSCHLLTSLTIDIVFLDKAENWELTAGRDSDTFNPLIHSGSRGFSWNWELCWQRNERGMRGSNIKLPFYLVGQTKVVEKIIILGAEILSAVSG